MKIILAKWTLECSTKISILYTNQDKKKKPKKVAESIEKKKEKFQSFKKYIDMIEDT